MNDQSSTLSFQFNIVYLQAITEIIVQYAYAILSLLLFNMEFIVILTRILNHDLENYIPVLCCQQMENQILKNNVGLS